MRSLWLSSLLLICLGCASNSYKNLSQIETKTIDSTLFPSFFKNLTPAALYKTDVTLYGKSIGGLLLLKYMPDSSYRIVFTNETGIKLFDFELKEDKFTVHFCIEKFNKDAVLQTIANDLKLVLLENRYTKQAAVLTDKENAYLIYKFNSKALEEYYYFNKKNGKIDRIEQSVGKKKRVIITILTYLNAAPKLVYIKHKNIRLTIDLNLIER